MEGCCKGRPLACEYERESEMKCSLLYCWEWVGSGREGESPYKGAADVYRVFSASVDMSGFPDGSLAWLWMRTPLDGWRPWEVMSQPSQLLFAEYQPFSKQYAAFTNMIYSKTSPQGGRPGLASPRRKLPRGLCEFLGASEELWGRS